MSEIVRTSVFLLNVLAAVLFLWLGVTCMKDGDLQSNAVVAVGVYSVLYNVYDLYKNTSLLGSVGGAVGSAAGSVGDVFEDTLDMARGAVSGVSQGVSSSTQ